VLIKMLSSRRTRGRSSAVGGEVIDVRTSLDGRVSNRSQVTSLVVSSGGPQSVES
jgi:hypothetical protein